MTSPSTESTAAATTESTAGTSTSPTRRRVTMAAGVLAVVTALGVGTLIIGTDPAPTAVAPGRALALTTPGGGLAASCAVPDAAGLAARNPVAFEGVVTSVSGTRVTLDVRSWFNNAQDGVTRVDLANPDGGGTVALDGVTFTAGRSYLVSAVDGMVSICGLTGESTPQLRALFTEAFPAAG